MRRTRPADAPVVRIEPDNEWAWCGERRLLLTPKAFAVLRHLVERPQQLVTKDDLLAAVWRDAIVSDAALSSCIRDLRRALRDASDRPRYIETVHRRGFRFIGPVASPTASGLAARPRSAHAAGVSPAAKSTLVGREADLARLHVGWATALSGRRHLALVTGESGIGKTALVDAFLAEIGLAEAPRVGRGQCVEQYGAGEAYLPVLEALGRLGMEPGGERLVEVLRQFAPTWLVQLPALLTDRDVDAVQRRAQGATRERMLRELVEALDALGTESPLVLVLEDLHWSDTATVDLLAMIARRRDAARLLVIGTYRPADVAQSAHHLRTVKRELELHGHCEEIALPFLDVAAVAEYLDRRFGPARFPAELAPALSRSTDGNPLFLVNTIEALVAQDHIRDAGDGWELAVPVAHVISGAPASLAQLVERQLERLTPSERAILPVVSVAGAEFSAAVASADGLDLQEAERLCEGLARRGQFLRAAGVAEWPDGTAAGRYAFIHALYQEVLYAGIPAGRLVGLHRRIGEYLERGHGERAREIAGELAVHFERGRDAARAVHYRRLAGDNALRHHGYVEAAEHARRALDLLAGSPDGPEREREELPLRMMLGSALAATQGFAGSEVAGIYARARELCALAGDDPSLFPVLLGLGRFHNIRGEVAIAHDVGRRLLALADATPDSAVRLAAHNGLGIMAFFGGDLEAALGHLDEGTRLYDPERHSPARSAVFRAGQDAGVSCLVYAAWALLLLGYPAQADARMREGLALARSLEHPFSLAYACHFGAALHGCRRERAAMQALEEEAGVLSTEYGFRLFIIAGAIHREWLASGGARAGEHIAGMRDAIAAWRAIGAELRTPAFLAALAEVCRDAERPEDGLRAVADGLTAGDKTGQHYWNAELYRLRGELALQADPASGTAETDLREAVEVARRQRAKWWELRAATSLCRLWAERGETARARAALSDVYHWFTEGFDMADLTEARALLERLADAGGSAPASGAGNDATIRRSSRASHRRR